MTVDRRAAHRRGLPTSVYDRAPCHHPPIMRATEHRIRPTRFVRRTATATTMPPELAAARAAIPQTVLGLNAVDLEELLIAIGDREDMAGADARARLARGRRALEAELERALAQ